MAEQKKLSIIAFSGDFDKLTAVFTLGTGAAAVGYEVNIFFTFWGLDAIKQKQGRSFTGGNWLTKLFGFMMGGLKVTPTSRFNFLGAGPKIFRYLMRKNNVATLEELVEATMWQPSKNLLRLPKCWESISMPARWRCTCLG